MIKAKEWLNTYRINKNRSKLLKLERERTENAIIIKTTHYGDETGGERRSIEDKYWSLIERKKEIDFELDFLNIDIKKVEEALEMVRAIYEQECDMMLLRHFYNNSNVMIQNKTNYSINSITSKIRTAERELEEILNPSR